MVAVKWRTDGRNTMSLIRNPPVTSVCQPCNALSVLPPLQLWLHSRKVHSLLTLFSLCCIPYQRSHTNLGSLTPYFWLPPAHVFTYASLGSLLFHLWSHLHLGRAHAPVKELRGERREVALCAERGLAGGQCGHHCTHVGQQRRRPTSCPCHRCRGEVVPHEVPPQLI
eukprot:1188669-Prorocentrum_minimum.AAC.2